MKWSELKTKLTSRKFWVAVAAFVTQLYAAFGGTSSEAETITALIMGGATVIAYIVGEGLIDAAAVKENINIKTEDKNNG